VIIPFIIVIVLLVAAVIFLVFQLNRHQRTIEELETAGDQLAAALAPKLADATSAKMSLEQQLSVSAGQRGELERQLTTAIANNESLNAKLAEQTVAMDAAMERMTAEATKQIREYQAKLDLEFAEKKRTEAAKTALRSRGALVAKVAEHVAPLLPEFNYALKDCRHVGEIFDFLIYDGLEEGYIRDVIFLEVKTSTSGRTRRVTNPREKLLRDAIVNHRVRYEIFQPDLGGADVSENDM
jgi:predicted Holliday junction resolvase-like endonuclease